MDRRSADNSKQFTTRLWTGIAVFALSACLFAQAQQGGSLADVARQARAQKQAAPAADAGQAQQFADQLSEDQNGKDAPGGFKAYSTGSIQVAIPAPFSATEQDSGGAVVSGPRVGTTVPVVLVGNPLVVHGPGEEAFHDAAIQFAREYAPDATCTKLSGSNQSGYQCSLAGASLLGHSVSGNALLLRVSDTVYPVVCAATTESRARDILNDPQASASRKMQARRVLAQDEEYVRQVWQKCETVFGSIRIKPNAGPQPEMAARNQAAAKDAEPKPEARPAMSASGTLAGSTVPEGFKVHAFNYCKSHNECWDASVLVPNEAKLVSSDCNQYVFELKVRGEPFLLLTGSEGGEGCAGRRSDDPNLVRWQQLVAPDNLRAPGTSNTISDQQMKLDGKRAIVTEIKFRKGLTEWIGKRAEIDSNGIPLVVGCMAQLEHFPDGDEICSNMIQSVRLP